MILAGLLMAVPFFTRAETPVRVDSGKIGVLSWYLEHPASDEADLTIYIDGRGAMDDFDLSDSSKQRPWENYMSEIKHVVVRSNVSRIGNYAFASNGTPPSTGIVDIDITAGVTSIGDRAFYGSSVTEITLPPTVETIGKESFSASEKLKSVKLEGNVALTSQLNEIGDYAFANCAALEKVTATDAQGAETGLPNNLTTINEGTFQNTKLTSVIIPNNVTEIKTKAFENCSGLKTVQFGGNQAGTVALTTIGDGAFKNAGLTQIELPANLRTIGEESFSGNNSLTGELIFPAMLETIGKGAFSGDKGFEGDLIIPDSVKTIGEAAFSGCSGFDGELQLPVGFEKKIESYTFNGCSGLTGTISIPATVPEIGDRAFYGAGKVTEIIINGSVTSGIGIAAFQGTTDAKEIIFKGAAPSSVYEAKAPSLQNSFDDTDVIVHPKGESTFEDDTVHYITTDDITTWYGYRVRAVEGGETWYPEFETVDNRDFSKMGAFKATIPDSNTVFPYKGAGYRLVISEYADSEGAKTPDPLEADVKAGVSTVTDDTIFHSYDISLYNYRSFYEGVASPAAIKMRDPVGNATTGVEVILPLPIEIVQKIGIDKTAGQLTNLKERLSLYTEADTTASGITTTYTEIADYSEDDTASTPTIKFTATHFSEYLLTYDPYIAPSLDPFVAVDLRAEENGGEGTQLYKGTANEGAPESSMIKITSPNHATGSFEEVTGKPNPTDGYRLEISYSDGAAIREAEWLATGRGVLLDTYRMLAPFKAELYKNCGRGYTREKVTEGFGSMSIQVPIPEEMDREKGTLQVLSLKTDTNNKSQIEVKTEANGGLNVGVVFGGTTAYAIFSTDHFSEFALYYVSNDAASDTSTTASTSSTEATTATGATTSSAADGTTATGAATSNAAAAGSTATGANTASTATTATTSSTLASGASVAASTGGSGATNRAGATTPVAVTTGSSGSASGSDMPTTGDSDFYRMTLSMALMLFGAYELISTIRIRKKGNR